MNQVIVREHVTGTPNSSIQGHNISAKSVRDPTVFHPIRENFDTALERIAGTSCNAKRAIKT